MHYLKGYTMKTVHSMVIRQKSIREITFSARRWRRPRAGSRRFCPKISAWDKWSRGRWRFRFRRETRISADGGWPVRKSLWKRREKNQQPGGVLWASQKVGLSDGLQAITGVRWSEKVVIFHLRILSRHFSANKWRLEWAVYYALMTASRWHRGRRRCRVAHLYIRSLVKWA